MSELEPRNDVKRLADELFGALTHGTVAANPSDIDHATLVKFLSFAYCAGIDHAFSKMGDYDY